MNAKTIFICALSLCVFLSAVSARGAQQYPARTITMIVPYSAGGTTDLTGRRFAVQLRKHLGKTVAVVNQSGASGAIGCKTVLDAPADGYTLLFCADSLGTQRVMGLSRMSYDDFIPIMLVSDDPKVIVAREGAYRSLQDLISDIKARPSKVKMSYTGLGGSGHVQSLIYNKFGLEAALTAYAGGGDALLAVIGGQVDFTNSNYSTVTPYIESGGLVLLGVSADRRLPPHPEVPALPEIIPEAERYLYLPFTPLSLLVHKDTPPEIVNILREAAKKVVSEPEWKAYAAENCLSELYLKYPDEASIKKFYSEWESYMSWLLYDAGAAKFNPEQFGIRRTSK